MVEASLPPQVDSSADELRSGVKDLKGQEEEKVEVYSAINLSGDFEEQTKTPAKDEVDSVHNPQSYRDNEWVNASIWSDDHDEIQVPEKAI